MTGARDLSLRSRCKDPTNTTRCVSLERGDPSAVDGLRDGGAGVSKYILNGLKGRTLIHGQVGERMTQIMDSDVPESGLVPEPASVSSAEGRRP